MLRGLIIIVVVLSGCCSQEKSTLKSPVIKGVDIIEQESIEDLNELSEPDLGLLDSDGYTPRTIEEKWLDFKKRHKLSNPENLLYFAEDLYDALEPRDNKRRMELSFFISQIYRKQGNRQKAKIYSEYFLNHLKSQQGGAAYKTHQTEKSAVKSIMDQINREGMGLDE